MTPWSCARTEDNLSAEWEGSMSAAEAAALARHRTTCPSCDELQRAFADVLESLRSLPVPEPRPGIERRFADAALAQRRPAPDWLPLPLAAALVAAVSGATLAAAASGPRLPRVGHEGRVVQERIVEKVERLGAELDSLQESAGVAARFQLERAVARIDEFRRWQQRQSPAQEETPSDRGALGPDWPEPSFSNPDPA